MYIVYSKDEMEKDWEMTGPKMEHITERDLRHIATMADSDSYEMYKAGDGDVGPFFWEGLSHTAVIERFDEDCIRFHLNAHHEYFGNEREVFRMILDKEGTFTILFSEWMDSEVLDFYQILFREWKMELNA